MTVEEETYAPAARQAGALVADTENSQHGRKYHRPFSSKWPRMRLPLVAIAFDGRMGRGCRTAQQMSEHDDPLWSRNDDAILDRQLLHLGWEGRRHENSMIRLR